MGQLATKELTYPEARRRLGQLFHTREELIELMNSKGMVDQQTLSRIRFVDDEIRVCQDFCNVELLESSNSLLNSLKLESRKLRWITIVLTILTAVLTVLTALALYEAFTR
jgi:hypothetical protein